jgi:ribosomal protein L19
MFFHSNIFDYFNDIKEKINSEIPLEILEEQEIDQQVNIDTTANNFYVKLRKERDFIYNSYILKKFLIGDVLEFVYFYKSTALTFSGICIAIKKKSFKLPDLSLILRNIIVKTGVEVTISYFYNRAYKLSFLDYKRKFYTYNKNKLYFIRERLNQESRS